MEVTPFDDKSEDETCPHTPPAGRIPGTSKACHDGCCQCAMQNAHATHGMAVTGQERENRSRASKPPNRFFADTQRPVIVVLVAVLAISMVGYHYHFDICSWPAIAKLYLRCHVDYTQKHLDVVFTQKYFEAIIDKASATQQEIGRGAGGAMITLLAAKKASGDLERQLASIQLGPELNKEDRDQIKEYMTKISQLAHQYRTFRGNLEDVMMVEHSILDLMSEELPFLFKALLGGRTTVVEEIVSVIRTRLAKFQAGIEKLHTEQKQITESTVVIQEKIIAFRSSKDQLSKKAEESAGDNILGAAMAGSMAIGGLIFCPLCSAALSLASIVQAANAVVDIDTAVSQTSASEALKDMENGLGTVIAKMKERSMAMGSLAGDLAMTASKVGWLSSVERDELTERFAGIAKSFERCARAYAHVLREQHSIG